jgi:CYTH domain-containing protein
MSTGKHCEIERKYLIRYPDIETLKAQKGVEQWEIVQIYLTTSGPGETRRIRQVVSDGQIRYYKAFKRHLSSVKNEEDEGEIDQMEYIRLSREQEPACKPLGKTRYRIPYAGHVLEFDIYPFWTDRAILEIELESENEGAAIPEYVQIIRDVSDDLAYKNRSLAENVIYEEI